jgi:hypothetical protein
MKIGLGVDLQVSMVSDFKLNEIDQIIEDVYDVADRKVIKKIRSGEILIQSVRDYCTYMTERYQFDPKAVSEVLKLKPQ